MKVFATCFCAVALVSCAHPYRVSRGVLRHLAKTHEPFVLVFGSLSVPQGARMRPSIRFVHQANRTAPEYLLYALTIASGDRFYALLKTPPELPWLNEFEAEVGAADAGFDRISYVRLHPGDAPLALYVGEIGVTPAQNRTTPGQTISVAIRDDFQNAQVELQRLYPHFPGSISKAPLLRNPVPQPTPPRLP